jgi:uncharacterized protein YsxB (DUF464 family)
VLFQDNLTLEENIRTSITALKAEKLALEEKSTFLHFTQEQLNNQVSMLLNVFFRNIDDLAREYRREGLVQLTFKMDCLI